VRVAKAGDTIIAAENTNAKLARKRNTLCPPLDNRITGRFTKEFI
jgi:hypothetical protein